MAKAGDQVRAADVSFWGVVALVCWGAAFLLANISALVPAGMLAGLHSSRLERGTINQLRAEVSALSDEAARMRRENNLLLQRFTLAEQARGEMSRRVGALEISVPQLLERDARSGGVDASVTASITESPAPMLPAEGGAVSVTRRPLPVPAEPLPQLSAAPAVAAPVARGHFAVALGFPLAPEDAEVQWQSLTARVGTLLLGLAPLLREEPDGSGQRLVAGPLRSDAEAEALCGRLDMVGIPCEPVAFAGTPLPLLN